MYENINVMGYTIKPFFDNKGGFGFVLDKPSGGHSKAIGFKNMHDAIDFAGSYVRLCRKYEGKKQK